MRLAIIAAGEGSRLQSDGISTPKPLIKISGTPMIDRIINIASENCIDEVFCIVNEGSVSLKEHLQNTVYKIPVNIFTRNTPSSLHSFYEMRMQLTDSFILTTGDTVFSEAEFRAFINYINSHDDFDVLLSVTPFFDDDKPLCVELDSDNKIVSFHNERDSHKWATGGIYFFRQNIIHELETAVNSGVHRLRNFFSMLLTSGANMKAYEFKRIIDVDHLQDIFQAEEFLKTLQE